MQKNLYIQYVRQVHYRKVNTKDQLPNARRTVCLLSIDTRREQREAFNTLLFCDFHLFLTRVKSAFNNIIDIVSPTRCFCETDICKVQ